MAMQTKIGNLYFGAGVNTKGYSRDINKINKKNADFSKQSKQQFQKLSKDLSNIPFFGKYLDRLKGVADGIKSIGSAAKGLATVSSSAGMSVKKGGAANAVSGSRNALLALQTADFARETKAEATDKKLQEEQNRFLLGRTQKEIRLQSQLDEAGEEAKRLARELKELGKESSNNEKELNSLKKQRRIRLDEEKRQTKTLSFLSDDLKNQRAEIAKLVQAGKELNDTEKARVKALRKEETAIETRINKITKQRQEQQRVDAELSLEKIASANKERNRLEERGKAVDKELKKQRATEEKFAKDLIATRKELLEKDRRDAKEKFRKETMLGKSIDRLEKTMGGIGKDFAKGVDMNTGNTGMSNMDGTGSLTGSAMRFLGVRYLMKRFPKLNKYMGTFAKLVLKSKNGFLILGGVIVGTVLVGITATVVAMRKLVAMGNKAADQFDVMAKQAKLLGVNVNRLNSLRQQGIQLAGMEAKAVDTAVQRFTRRLSDGTLDKKLAEMGFTLQEINNLKMENPAKALDKVRKKFSEIASEGERLRLAFAMFDTEGAKFALALAEQGNSIDEINAKMERYGLIVSANQKRALEATKATNEQLEMMAEGTSTQAGAAAAGLAESWNKLKIQFLESTRLVDLFNFVAVKAMKAVEIAIDLVRVAMAPFELIAKAGGAAFDYLKDKMESLFKPTETFLKSLDLAFAKLREISKTMWGIGDPFIDLTESVLELIGYESAITDELGNQDAIRQKMAADRAKELEDMEAKRKAAERELEVLKKGEKAVRAAEIVDEYRQTIAGGPMEGESNQDYIKRVRQAEKDATKARNEYKKQYDAQMAAEKKIADFKEKRAKEIADIEKKNEENKARIQQDADREREAAEKAGSRALSIASNLFGSQSFSAGQSFEGGSSEEYSYLRDRKMAEQRRNEEKIAREKMQNTLDSIDSRLALRNQEEEFRYQDEASNYAANNEGVETNSFNGIDPS